MYIKKNSHALTVARESKHMMKGKNEKKTDLWLISSCLLDIYLWGLNTMLTINYVIVVIAGSLKEARNQLFDVYMTYKYHYFWMKSQHRIDISLSNKYYQKLIVEFIK